MIPLIINKVPQFTVRPPKKIKPLSWTVGHVELLCRWTPSTDYHVVTLQRTHYRRADKTDGEWTTKDKQLDG